MKKLPQAVILAAGHSSRFWPLNQKHKSLIKIMGRPLIWYTLESLNQAGIKDLIIIQGPQKDIEATLKNYKSPNLKIKYVIQLKPKGMGNAVSQVKNLIRDNFFVMHAHHFDINEFVKPIIEKQKKTRTELILLGGKVDKPWKYGIVELDKKIKDKVIKLTEQPKKEKELSNIGLKGIYLLPRDFFQYYKKIKKHIYDFEDTLQLYLENNDVRIIISEKETFSLKYSWDLFRLKEFLASRMKSFISPKAKVRLHAIIQGPVTLEEGAYISEGAVLKGPVYVGKNAFVGNNTLIRENTFLEEGVKIGSMSEVKNSLFMKNSSLHSGFVGNSIVGENTKIGAGFVTANRRFDRGEISVYLKKEKIPTGNSSLGAIIGHNVSIGIQSGTMPGVLVGSNSIIYPGTMVHKNIPENKVIKRSSRN